MRLTGKWLFLFLISFLVFSVLGCAATHEGKGDVTTVDGTIPVTADNAQLREFNAQLGEIEDQASAEKAVNTFVTYVDSRIAKEDGVSAQSLSSLLGADLVRQVAQNELAARKGEGMTSFSVNDSTFEALLEIEKPLIDVGTVTDQINELGGDTGYRVKDEDIELVKMAVEESVPNLNPDGNTEMTPLQAMAVGYAVASGDDGSASDNSVELPIDKVNSFVEEIVE